MKKFTVCLALVIAVCLLTAGPAAALQFVSDPLDGVKVQDARLAWELSQTYQMAVSAEQVSYLRNYMGYGEIAMLYGMADASGKPAGDILAFRKQDNLGWGAIAQQLGGKLPDYMPKASAILKKLKLDDEEKAFMAKMEQSKEEDKPVMASKDGKPGVKADSGKPSAVKPVPPKKTISKAD